MERAITEIGYRKILSRVFFVKWVQKNGTPIGSKNTKCLTNTLVRDMPI